MLFLRWVYNKNDFHYGIVTMEVDSPFITERSLVSNKDTVVHKVVSHYTSLKEKELRQTKKK